MSIFKDLRCFHFRWPRYETHKLMSCRHIALLRAYRRCPTPYQHWANSWTLNISQISRIGATLLSFILKARVFILLKWIYLQNNRFISAKRHWCTKQLDIVLHKSSTHSFLDLWIKIWIKFFCVNLLASSAFRFVKALSARLRLTDNNGTNLWIENHS